MSLNTLATTSIIGQPAIILEVSREGFEAPWYLVTYGTQETRYETIKDALNGYNQCCLHAETNAGMHNTVPADLGEELAATVIEMAKALGYTEMAWGTYQDEEISILTQPDVDLDSRFKAFDVDSQEYIWVNGWLAEWRDYE